MDGIKSTEQVIVTGHAVCRYIERHKKGTCTAQLADMVIRSKAITDKQKRRLGLVVTDDGSYEWRRIEKVLLLLRFGKDEDRKRCAVLITVMDANDARQQTANHRKTVTNRPRKPRKLKLKRRR